MKDHAKPSSARRIPTQDRSQHTVDCILEGAARIFRREGFAATTNRIAAEAGVSIGSLYEYFPHKQALLHALAERHLLEAERGVAAALGGGAGGDRSTRELLAALQSAIVSSHRYPSQALTLVSDPKASAALHERACQLREQVSGALLEHARANQCPNPELRARTAFGLLAELTSITAYEVATPDQHVPLAAHLLESAIEQLIASRVCRR